MNRRFSSLSLIAMLAHVLSVGCSPQSKAPHDAAAQDGGATDTSIADMSIADTSVDTFAFLDAQPGDADIRDAGTPVSCPVVGRTELRPCGRCGIAVHRCTSDGLGGMHWVISSECESEGACYAGDVDVRPSLGCGLEQSTCTSACVWGPYTSIQPDLPNRECNHGEAREADSSTCTDGKRRFETCSAQCTWSGQVSECGGGCPGQRRTEPPDREEICIPGGNARILVDNTSSFTAWMTPYYIDRYPVTYRRYDQCMRAGFCPYVGYPAEAQANLDAPIRETTFKTARAYCLWDGSRELPTTARWQKAYQGPAPNERVYPWSPRVMTCFDIPAKFLGCQVPELPTLTTNPFDRYDSFPGTESYYGVSKLSGGFKEWGRDFFWDLQLGPWPNGVIDPVFLDIERTWPNLLAYVVHGSPRASTYNSMAIPSDDESYRIAIGTPTFHIRCVRSAR